MTDILTAIARQQNGVNIPAERIARYRGLVEETNTMIARAASELISLSTHGDVRHGESADSREKVQS